MPDAHCLRRMDSISRPRRCLRLLVLLSFVALSFVLLVRFFASDARLAIALLPLAPGIVGVACGRVWGAFLMLGTGAFLVGGAAFGGLPMSLAAVGLGAGVSFLLVLPLLWRSDPPAALLSALLSMALGAGATSLLAPDPRPAAAPADVDREILLAEEPATLMPASALLEICTPKPARENRHPREPVYDFEDEVLRPLAFGPIVEEMPRVTYPRGREEIARAFEDRAEHLRRCYRFARYHQPDLEGQLEVEMQIHPFGHTAITRITPRMRMKGGAALADCARGALRSLRLASYSLRFSEARLALRFRPSNQSRPHRPPTPPAPRLAPSEPPPGVCLVLPQPREEEAPDRVTLTRPVLTVDDFDPDQQAWEREQEHRRHLREWVRGGHRGPRPLRPRPVLVVTSQACGVKPALSADLIRRTLRYNLGRYRECYRETLVHRPGLSGRVTVLARIDDGGIVEARIQSSTVANEEIESCLRDAVQQVWFPPLGPDRRAIVHYPFLLEPGSLNEPQPPAPRRGTVGQIEERAAKRLSLGDGKTALRYYAALLQQRPAHPQRCLWNLGALESTLAIAPWIDDRVLAAAKQLAAALHADRGRVCLERATPVLSHLATDPHRMSQRLLAPGLLEVAVDRYALLLGITPPLLDHEDLRYFLAEALYRLQRFEEASREYEILSRGRGKHRQEALEGLQDSRARARREE
jgi:hypothetical protein